MPFPPAYSVGSVYGLGPDLFGIRSVSLSAIELPRVRTRSSKAWGRFFALIFVLRSDWAKKFLAPSLARGAADAFTIVSCLDRNGKLDDSPQDKKQMAEPQHCFAGNFSRTLPDKSLYVLQEFLDRSVAFALWRFSLHEFCVVCRPSWSHCWFLRILCNGFCTAQRFHTEGVEQMCRIGCLDEPDPLAHHNECPLLYNLFPSYGTTTESLSITPLMTCFRGAKVCSKWLQEK